MTLEAPANSPRPEYNVGGRSRSVAAPLLNRASRRLALVGRLAETWFHRPPSPNRLVLDITRRCNLRCAMCRTWEREAAHELTPDEIGRLMGELDRLTWLDVTGGEPFLRADIDEVFGAIAERARALHMLHFQTNGWMTSRIEQSTAVLRERLTDCDLIVTVSIDGPPSVHDRIRGREGSARRAVATANALTQLEGVEVHIGTTVSMENVDALSETERWLRSALSDFDRRRWHWNWVQRSEHFFANAQLPIANSQPSPQLLHEHLRARGWPRTMVEAMESVYLLNLEAFHRTGERAVACQALRSTAFISPEGDVYPCHIYDRPVGNVRAGSFASIWGGAKTAEVRRDVEALRCGGCFSACEAYPAIAGAPLQTAGATAKAVLQRWRR